MFLVEGSSPYLMVLPSHPRYGKPSTNVTIVQLPADCGRITNISPRFFHQDAYDLSCSMTFQNVLMMPSFAFGGDHVANRRCCFSNLREAGS